MNDVQKNTSAPGRAKNALLITIEVLLVAIIVGLLVATWLPAIIGANHDAPHFP